GEGHPTYWYFAIALLGSAMTPYEVFFFSSGAVEEGWSTGDLIVNRMNVYLGFPLGGALALAVMVAATLFLEPRGIDPSNLAAALPLTYFPILVVANDPDYMGSKVNSKLTNAAGSVLLVILVVIMLAAGPLMIVTKAGQ